MYGMPVINVFYKLGQRISNAKTTDEEIRFDDYVVRRKKNYIFLS